jgi:phosphatidylglycerophosphatase A
LWWLVPKDIYVQAGVALVAFVLGIWLCGESAKRIGVHDHGGIVWDEILGMFLTLMVIPSLIPMEPVWILAAFMAFRLFDIWKPWPIRDLDHRLHGGLGIMLDDVLAALYAALLLSFLHKLLF